MPNLLRAAAGAVRRQGRERRSFLCSTPRQLGMSDLLHATLLVGRRRVNCSYPMHDVKVAVRPALRATPKAVVSVRVRFPQGRCGGWSLFTGLNSESVTKFYLSGYRVNQALSIFDLQPSLASLFRPRFADPHHAAQHGIRAMLVQNELDKLSSFEAGGPSYLETVLRVTEAEAWNPLRLPPILNDQTGALFQGCSLQSSALGNGSAGHCSPSIYVSIQKAGRPVSGHVVPGCLPAQ